MMRGWQLAMWLTAPMSLRTSSKTVLMTCTQSPPQEKSTVLAKKYSSNPRATFVYELVKGLGGGGRQFMFMWPFSKKKFCRRKTWYGNCHHIYLFIHSETYKERNNNGWIEIFGCESGEKESGYWFSVSCIGVSLFTLWEKITKTNAYGKNGCEMATEFT